ncbi:GNAT family N-acetyltransferase [Chengkuizengella sp. SCS-71B]|uniref:GNAT family N-acetyltransferase n=1 Tax=Chengkuizengella sp. SCS-71B TaxID=3115290 RepID=UPI0032C24935
MSFLLSDESVLLRVAEYEIKLIGYCLGFDHYTFYANGRVSWIEEIMIEEVYRNEGIGTKLINCFEGWTKINGKIRLEFTSVNLTKNPYSDKNNGNLRDLFLALSAIF